MLLNVDSYYLRSVYLRVGHSATHTGYGNAPDSSELGRHRTPFPPPSPPEGEIQCVFYNMKLLAIATLVSHFNYSK